MGTRVEMELARIGDETKRQAELTFHGSQRILEFMIKLTPIIDSDLILNDLRYLTEGKFEFGAMERPEEGSIEIPIGIKKEIKDTTARRIIRTALHDFELAQG